jgi:hypothetical protein
MFPSLKNKTWNQLFQKNAANAKKRYLKMTSVLLTDIGNKPNWFGGISL